MKRALVTGASGFIGANLSRRLLADDHDVHVLVRASGSSWRLVDVASEVHVHTVDLRDGDLVRELVRAIRPDWVFHLAAYGAYSSQVDVDEMIRTNISGTMNLVRASVAVGCEVLVNAGSSSEYGFKDHAPTENEWLEPNSDYAVTKACATHFCGLTARSSGLNIVTLRLYSVFGPYEEPTRLIPRLLVDGLAGRLPPLVDPDIARDFVHVDDVCEAFTLAATQAPGEPGTIYNVGSGRQTRLEDLVELTRRLIGNPAKPVWRSMAAREWDTSCWIADAGRIERVLGWRPRHSLEGGLRATLAWFAANPQHAGRYSQLGGLQH